MEEDIDRAIKNIEKDIELSKEGEGFYTEVLCNKEDLENLLTRYKELEKENNKALKVLENTAIALADSISKSELKKDLKHMKNAKAKGVKQLLMKKGIIGYLEKLLREE